LQWAKEPNGRVYLEIFKIRMIMDNGTYEMGGYVYTVSNITTDRALVVSYAQTQKVFIKVNGAWEEATKVYIKISGSWVQSDTLHVKDNGIWKS
jgi:hypothetical protein